MERSGMNTTTTAKKGWEQKNETEHCKKRDSPIRPSDPQASTTISGGCPLMKNWSVATSLLGFKGAGVAANEE